MKLVILIQIVVASLVFVACGDNLISDPGWDVTITVQNEETAAPIAGAQVSIAYALAPLEFEVIRETDETGVVRHSQLGDAPDHIIRVKKEGFESRDFVLPDEAERKSKSSFSLVVPLKAK